MTGHVFIFLLLFVPVTGAPAQSVWDSWPAEVINKLNTASDVSYLNEEEKKVILFTNMARYDGPLFARTFLDTYVEEKKVENSAFLRSLRRDLSGLDRLAPLYPEKDLSAIAQGHASKSGRQGQVGHQDFNRRFEPLLGNPYNHVGENCSYGFETAIDIVISLLIDEGVKDHGHRKNLLSDSFNSIGVAIRPHKSYRTNCVMDFGQRDRSGMNELPY